MFKPLLIPIGIVAATAIPVIVAGLIVRRYRNRTRAERRSPITRHLSRAPGSSLATQLEDLGNELDAWLVILMTSTPVLIALHLGESYWFQYPETPVRTGANVLFALTVIVICTYKLRKVAAERWRLMHALDAERSIGQTLNVLMSEGAWACHDLPAEGFNIDHVFVSKYCVYAVETKSHLKPNWGRRGDDARVVFENGALRFPDMASSEMLVQAKRQASWLAKWLSAAVGEPVAVKAVLALPGWYIEQKERCPVFLTNGENAKFLVASLGNDRLDEPFRKRIIHQLDQRCRDVEPSAFRTHLRIVENGPATS